MSESRKVDIMTKRRVALFGGSFNPPHYGHFLAASWALLDGSVGEVWMLPCFRHAFGKELAPFEDRIEMCKLGAELLSEKIKVFDWERRFETIYTVDTIARLKELYPEIEFRLLIGSDILNERELWKDFLRIEELAPPLVAPRGGFGTRQLLPQLSSTEIRDLIRNGEPIEDLVPKPIAEYIAHRRLYH